MKVICDVCNWSGQDTECKTIQARNKGTGEVSGLGVMGCPACHENGNGIGKIRVMEEGEEAPINQEDLHKYFASIDEWSQIMPVHASVYDWFCMLGGLQLALRHPKMTGPAASIVREICYQIAMSVIKEIRAIDENFVRQAGWTEFGIDAEKLYKNIVTPDKIDVRMN